MDCSAFWLAQIQRQLMEALPVCLDTTESQAADLRTSQHWLRTMVWQLSIANRYLSSSSSDASMTFTYPIEIAKDLVAVTNALSQSSMEIHGIGLVSLFQNPRHNSTDVKKIEKVFDVACSLIDVMACVPINASNFEMGPLHYLTQLVNLMTTLRGGGSRYVPLVIARIQETLPNIAPSIIQSLDLELPDGHYRGSKTKRSSSNSSTSSPFSTPLSTPPFSTPPFMHYYPLT